jgi:hypothetical protein
MHSGASPSDCGAVAASCFSGELIVSPIGVQLESANK